MLAVGAEGASKETVGKQEQLELKAEAAVGTDQEVEHEEAYEVSSTLPHLAELDDKHLMEGDADNVQRDKATTPREIRQRYAKRAGLGHGGGDATSYACERGRTQVF